MRNRHQARDLCGLHPDRPKRWRGPDDFLGEVQELRERGEKARLHVERKGVHGEFLASRVIDEVGRHHAAERVIAMSFDLASAVAARQAGGGSMADSDEPDLFGGPPPG